VQIHNRNLSSSSEVPVGNGQGDSKLFTVRLRTFRADGEAGELTSTLCVKE